MKQVAKRVAEERKRGSRSRREQRRKEASAAEKTRVRVRGQATAGDSVWVQAGSEARQVMPAGGSAVAEAMGEGEQQRVASVEE